MYAIGDELNAIVLCELAILFALICSIGIDRLHIIASNVLRGVYGILDKAIVCGVSSLDLNVSDKARLAWLIRGFCDIGAVTLHLLPILSTILGIWVMWVLKALGADFLLVSNRDDAFLGLVVLLREHTTQKSVITYYVNSLSRYPMKEVACPWSRCQYGKRS